MSKLGVNPPPPGLLGKTATFLPLIPSMGRPYRGSASAGEPKGRDAIVARLVHAVEEQSGPTERMVVPAESVGDSPPAERLDLDVAFGQPQGTASCSAA